VQGIHPVRHLGTKNLVVFSFGGPTPTTTQMGWNMAWSSRQKMRCVTSAEWETSKLKYRRMCC